MLGFKGNSFKYLCAKGKNFFNQRKDIHNIFYIEDRFRASSVWELLIHGDLSETKQRI